MIAEIGWTSFFQGSVDLLGDAFDCLFEDVKPYRFSAWKSVLISPNLGKRSVQGWCNPETDLSRWLGVLAGRFACCRAFGGLIFEAVWSQRCHTDLLSVLEDLCLDLNLVLQLVSLVMTAVSPRSSPLLISHCVVSFAPFQPLLI